MTTEAIELVKFCKFSRYRHCRLARRTAPPRVRARTASPLVQRHGRRKGRALIGTADDRQPSAMARQDVLDDREAKAGAVLRAALPGVDAIESFCQARQMFGRDAAAEVAHDEGAVLRGLDDRDFDAVPSSRLGPRAIFYGVLDQVLRHSHQFVAISGDDDG